MDAGAAVIVHTARLRYMGEDRLDITRGSGHGLGLLFAPSETLLNGYRKVRREVERARVGSAILRARFAQYADLYATELRIAERAHPLMWTELEARGEVTLCCYCYAPTLCHRSVLARMLVARGATYEGERET